MATAFMKRNHATVWVPPRTQGERAFAADAVFWVARAQGPGKPMQLERQSLDSMTGLKSVNLIFDARDVSLLSVELPVLPAAKLARAIPNIVEDQVLQDVASCAFAVGTSTKDGARPIAVIDRAWLEFVVGAFERRNLWVTAAWPGQLTLPMEPGTGSMLCINDGVSIRTGIASGTGWSATNDPAARAETVEAAIVAAANGRKPGSDTPHNLVVFCDDVDWAPGLELAARKLDLTLKMQGLQATRNCPIDLLSARQSNAGERWLANIDWRAWRLPLALSAACLVAFLVGLNLHWAKLVRERSALKANLELKFRQTFPNTPVIVDPMLQMQRQVSGLRLRTGQSGPEDFAPLLARLPQAMAGRSDALAGVEYREGRLRLRFSPTFVESRASREGLIESFRRQGLGLKFDSESQATAAVSLVS